MTSIKGNPWIYLFVRLFQPASIIFLLTHLMDESSDSSSTAFLPEPVVHVSLRALDRKVNPPPKGPQNPKPSGLSISAIQVGPRPTTAPTSSGSKAQNTSHYSSGRPGSQSRRKSRSPSPHREGHPNRLAASSSQSVLSSSPHPSDPLHIPMNTRDKVALKLGRRMIHGISLKYDEPNSDSAMKHSRYFVDKWLASFDTGSDTKTVTPFGMEMLSRMTAKEATLRLADTQEVRMAEWQMNSDKTKMIASLLPTDK